MCIKPTCDGQIDPSAIWIWVISALKEDDWALIPAVVTLSDAADLNRRVVEKANATLVVGVDVCR